MSDTADRFNDGKPQLSFVLDARYALEGVAAVLEFGAKKYSRGNWKKGLDKHQIVDSLMRHLTKYLSGEEVDDESGCHHLDHVLANALFLADQENGRRPGPVPVLEPKHKGPLPKHLKGYEKSLGVYDYDSITTHWGSAPDYLKGYEKSTADLAKYSSLVAANHATLQEKPDKPRFIPPPGVGKRVRLTEDAQFHRTFHGRGRVDAEGVIERLAPDHRFPWTVRWDDGTTGLFQTQDLEVIDS